MRKLLVIGLVLTLGLLSGCAVNKGTSLAADFDRRWTGTPQVAEVKTTAQNPLPFAGNAIGELVVADGTPLDRIAELAGELRAYVADNDDVTGRITAEGVTVTIVDDQDFNTESLTLWQSLVADDRVIGGDLDEANDPETIRRRIRVFAVDPEAVMAVFQDMVSEGDQHTPLQHVWTLAVQTDWEESPSVTVETAYDGSVPDQAIAAYEAVRAEHEVVTARILADRITGSKVRIVVGPDSDPVAAAELARAAAPGLAALEVTN